MFTVAVAACFVWRYVMLTLTLLLYCHTMLPGDRRSVVTTACCRYWCRYAARHDLFAAYVFQLSVLSARHCCRRSAFFCLCCQHLFWQKLPPPPIMLMEIVCWNQCTLVCMYVWVCVCIVKSWRGAMVPERVGAPFRQIFFSQNGAPVIIVSSQVECWRCSVPAHQQMCCLMHKIFSVGYYDLKHWNCCHQNCQISRLKCTDICSAGALPLTCCGAYSATPDHVAGFKGPTSKGQRERKGMD